jgi:hypothetical protein
LTDEVTAEQMFEWDKENKSKWRRVYCGLIKRDGSDVQCAIWSHGYRMVYWRVSKDVVSIEKMFWE